MPFIKSNKPNRLRFVSECASMHQILVNCARNALGISISNLINLKKIIVKNKLNPLISQQSTMQKKTTNKLCCTKQMCRYQFFLQIKQDIQQSRLPVTNELAEQLLAYIIQCKFLMFARSVKKNKEEEHKIHIRPLHLLC